MSFPGVSRQRRIMTVCCLTTAKASSNSLAWSSTGGGVVVMSAAVGCTIQVPGSMVFLLPLRASPGRLHWYGGAAAGVMVHVVDDPS
jgi:hypothetical protein